MKKRLIGSFLLILFISLLAKEKELRPYRLVNADSLIATKIDNEYVTHLSGNVHFFYGETEFFSDFARIYEKKKISSLFGNVKVFDDTLSLFADRVDYYRLREEIFLNGNVFVKEVHSDSTFRTFESERAEYYRDERKFVAIDDVRAFDQKEKFRGKCGYLNYDIAAGYGYLIKNPVVSVEGEDSLAISAEKIEYFNDFKKITASFNVETKSTEFKINSDFLLYFENEEKAIFQGKPVFRSELARASAEEFQLKFRDKKIIFAQLTDSCRVDFKTESEETMKNWVTADLMKFYFSDGKLSECRAEFNVKSFYRQEKSEKKDFLINKADGDKLIITLDTEGKLETIAIKKKVSGKYKFFKK